jgi:hypothetical protein
MLVWFLGRLCQKIDMEEDITGEGAKNKAFIRLAYLRNLHKLKHISTATTSSR